MLNHLVDKWPALKHDVQIVGYHNQNNHFTLLRLDCPKGYAVRLRRCEMLPFPTSRDDFTRRMPAILKAAMIGRAIMEDTLQKINSSRSELTVSRGFRKPLVLPPVFLFDTTSGDSSSSTSKKSKF